LLSDGSRVVVKDASKAFEAKQAWFGVAAFYRQRKSRPFMRRAIRELVETSEVSPWVLLLGVWLQSG